MPELKTIPLQSIVADECFRYRSTKDRETTVERLASDIEANGLLTPLIVREAGKDQHQLIAGYRRHGALTSLAEASGEDRHVRALVYPEGTGDRELLDVRFAENMERKNLSPMDLAFAAFKLATQDGLEHEEIRKLLRMRTVKTVQRHLRLTRAPEEIQEAVNEGWLGITAALAIMEAGSKKAMASLFSKIKAAYEAEEGAWSVRAIREAIAKKKSVPELPRDSIKALKKEHGVGIRRDGAQYKVTVSIDPFGSIEELAEKLRGVVDAFAPTADANDGES